MISLLERNKKYLVYLPLIVYWILIFTATSLPGNDLPNVGVNDKIEHFSAYLILALLLNLALVFQNRYPKIKVNAAIYTIIFMAFYALFDELHQLFIPGRDCEILDWCADFIGSLLGVLFITLLLFIGKYHPQKNENNQKMPGT